MTAEPVARLDKCDVWFVAPNDTWTRDQTRDEFAMRSGPEPGADGRGRVVVTLDEYGGFSLDSLPGRTFRLTLVGIAPAQWAFAVVEDRE